jgi:hypothetical protein
MRPPSLRFASSLGTRLGHGLPGFRALGPGSVSSLLKTALDITYGLLIFLTLLTCLVFVVVAIIPMDQVGLTVTSDTGGTRIPLPRAHALFGIGAFVGYFGGFALILRHLRRIFRTLTLGDPFHPDNVSRLKQVGYILAIVTGGVWLGQLLVSRLVRGVMDPPSLFNLVTPAFSVLVVFVLAEVFREGARLRRESELTI